MSLFNSTWYLLSNPDVGAALAAGTITSAEEHFQKYGQFEGRSPSPIFNEQFYLQQNPDVAAALEAGVITSAFQHFVQYGQEELRGASPFFSPSLYLALNPDVAASGMNPFAHFETYGHAEPRPLSPFFDAQAYLDANPDVAEAIENGVTTAYEHFIAYGFQEGRDLGNGLSLAQFADDPVSQTALKAGDFFALAARVAEVAPFIPSYQPPAGYTIPANTPIPLDFVPVEGEKLVIPDGVKVPPGTELPDIFEPVEQFPGGGGGGDPTPVPVTTEVFTLKGGEGAGDLGTIIGGTGHYDTLIVNMNGKRTNEFHLADENDGPGVVFESGAKTPNSGGSPIFSNEATGVKGFYTAGSSPSMSNLDFTDVTGFETLTIHREIEFRVAQSSQGSSAVMLNLADTDFTNAILDADILIGGELRIAGSDHLKSFTTNGIVGGTGTRPTFGTLAFNGVETFTLNTKKAFDGVTLTGDSLKSLTINAAADFGMGLYKLNEYVQSSPSVGIESENLSLLNLNNSAANRDAAFRVVVVEAAPNLVIDASEATGSVNVSTHAYNAGTGVTITSGSGADDIWGSSGNDVISVGDGDDSVSTGFGADHVDLGLGKDKLSLFGSGAFVAPTTGTDEISTFTFDVVTGFGDDDELLLSYDIDATKIEVLDTFAGISVEENSGALVTGTYDKGNNMFTAGNNGADVLFIYDIDWSQDQEAVVIVGVADLARMPAQLEKWLPAPPEYIPAG